MPAGLAACPKGGTSIGVVGGDLNPQPSGDLAGESGGKGGVGAVRS